MDILTYLLKQVEKRQAEVSDVLMSNGISNMEEYHHYMGRVSAFGDIEQMLKEVRNRMETADDD